MFVVERVFTNRAANVRGSTTSVTVRLPDEIVAYIDTHLGDDIANRSEFLQHWAQVGVRVSMSDELTEALDWALQDPEVEPPSILEAPMSEYVPPEDPPWMVAKDVPLEAAFGELLPPLEEIAALHEAQLEALRSRVK